MQRPLLVLLAAFDAVITAAAGLAALLAPLTLLWILAPSGEVGTLWPTTVTLWQFGHGTPLDVALADETVRGLGIDSDAAEFTLSLAPLAFVTVTVLIAARSGARAARAGAWLTGVITGTLVFTAISVLLARTGESSWASVGWEALAFPALAYALAVLVGAIVTAWQRGDSGGIDRLRARVEDSLEWSMVLDSIVRGTAMVLVGLIGAGALGLALATFARMGDVVALYEVLHADLAGAVVITLGQLAYLPTMIVWTVSWLAGPGFALGTGTAVSPAGTELGVLPAVPILGILPADTSVWMFVVVLVPIAVGAGVGWAIRSRLVWAEGDLLFLPRVAIAVGIGLGAAACGAGAAWLASGALGPGRMAELGPDPGALAVALGIEVIIGAAILLLTPRHRAEVAAEQLWSEHTEPRAGSSVFFDLGGAAEVSAPTASDTTTEPIDLGLLGEGPTGPGEPPRTG